MKKVLTVVSDIFLVLLLIASTLIMVLVFTSKKGGGMPELFGYSPLSVQSDSMDAAPAFIKKGDLIIIEHRSSYSDLEAEKDVITFMAYNPQGVRYFNTHRIVEVIEKPDQKYYATKGDNAPDVDLTLVSEHLVQGVWKGKKISGLGAVMDFMGSQKGIFIVLILPLAIVFILQLVKFIGLVGESKKEEALEEAAQNLEAEKQKAIEEFKAQQEKEEDAVKVAALAAEEIEREKQKAVEEYIAKQKAQEEAAAELELAKQKAVEEYIAQQKAKEEAEQATVEKDEAQAEDEADDVKKT